VLLVPLWFAEMLSCHSPWAQSLLLLTIYLHRCFISPVSIVT
jgi:hypothetical protein